MTATIANYARSAARLSGRLAFARTAGHESRREVDRRFGLDRAVPRDRPLDDQHDLALQLSPVDAG